MQQQLKNVEHGFNDLIRKLDEKKKEITHEFERKFKKEEQKFMSKQNMINTDFQQIDDIEKIFEELIQFVDQNNDA